MGASKTDHFESRQVNIALIGKALGHPARIAIMEYLARVDACICGDIVNELPLAQPTVSQHLRELKNAGLIKGEIDGNAICYCIDYAAVNELRDFLDHISSKTVGFQNECC